MRDKHIVDTRIHACLYFIAPTGHTLKAIDIVVMKKLSEVVNVVPVIAKSDSLTLEEREAFKERVRVLLSTGRLVAPPADDFCPPFRFGQSWLTTTSESIRLTPRRTMTRSDS